MNIAKMIDLVKRQVSYHEYASRKAQESNSSRGFEKQTTLGTQYADLHKDLILLEGLTNDIGTDTIIGLVDYFRSHINASDTDEQAFSPDITLDDISDLSDEERELLGLSDSAKIEFQILEFIRDNGGVASVRKVMIGLKRMTGEMPEKQSLNNRLYRMANRQPKVLYSAIEYGQGYYTTIPPDDSDTLNVTDHHEE